MPDIPLFGLTTLIIFQRKSEMSSKDNKCLTKVSKYLTRFKALS